MTAIPPPEYEDESAPDFTPAQIEAFRAAYQRRYPGENLLQGSVDKLFCFVRKKVEQFFHKEIKESSPTSLDEAMAALIPFLDEVEDMLDEAEPKKKSAILSQFLEKSQGTIVFVRSYIEKAEANELTPYTKDIRYLLSLLVHCRTSEVDEEILIITTLDALHKTPGDFAALALGVQNSGYYVPQLKLDIPEAYYYMAMFLSYKNILRPRREYLDAIKEYCDEAIKGAKKLFGAAMLEGNLVAMLRSKRMEFATILLQLYEATENHSYDLTYLGKIQVVLADYVRYYKEYTGEDLDKSGMVNSVLDSMKVCQSEYDGDLQKFRAAWATMYTNLAEIGRHSLDTVTHLDSHRQAA